MQLPTEPQRNLRPLPVPFVSRTPIYNTGPAQPGPLCHAGAAGLQPAYGTARPPGIVWAGSARPAAGKNEPRQHTAAALCPGPLGCGDKPIGMYGNATSRKALPYPRLVLVGIRGLVAGHGAGGMVPGAWC